MAVVLGTEMSIDSNLFDRYAAENGNCFRTREGAEMWLKLMKGMLE